MPVGYSGFGTAAVPTIGAVSLAYLAGCNSLNPDVVLVPFTDSGTFPSGGPTTGGTTVTFTAPVAAPAVLAVFPPVGPTSGYSPVFVFGRRFDQVTAATFGGNRALWHAFGQSLLLILTPPAAAPGPSASG